MFLKDIEIKNSFNVLNERLTQMSQRTCKKGNRNYPNKNTKRHECWEKGEEQE